MLVHGNAATAVAAAAICALPAQPESDPMTVEPLRSCSPGSGRNPVMLNAASAGPDARTRTGSVVGAAPVGGVL